jgi:hypothetical protein
VALRERIVALCALAVGGSKERVKGSFFVFDWVPLASITLCLFGGFGRRVFIHITAILGLLILILVRFPFATRLLSPVALEASFLIRLEVIDKFVVPIGVIALP